MSTAHIDLHGQLDFFVLREWRDATIALPFNGRQSVKHLIESLGVPHTEVGMILVNGQARDFGYITQDGDRIEVYPVSNGCPIEPKFLLDNHLGRLAVYLRMLGFDALYRNDYTDAELVELIQIEERILLSRDRRLLMRKVVVHGYCLRSLDSAEQLAEVVRRFDLAGQIKPFHRCLRCNHPLQPVSKEAVLNRLELLTKLYFDEFRICPACDQVYWKGSHYERMQGLIARVTGTGGRRAVGL